MCTFKRHRFPPDIISYAVWLYYRFNLSHRDIEDQFNEVRDTHFRMSLELQREFGQMNKNPTYFGLLAEFGESEIPLDRTCEKYFGLSVPKAKRRACLQQLPIPAYRGVSAPSWGRRIPLVSIRSASSCGL